ncbi:MAG: carboxymuconolactone decarboxylase family protein [Myxococcales bacterium]|nr:carboxymuconolactone decarboxylase family protein [Myxococcales bacterium]
MSQLPKPPKTFDEFSKRFPKIALAWGDVAAAGKQGPLDERTARLVKLGIAIGAMREGATHSSVRKALAAGVTEDELDQVVALSVGTLGFPAAVAAFSWIRDELIKRR